MSSCNHSCLDPSNRDFMCCPIIINILSWKEPIRITESNSWPCTKQPKQSHHVPNKTLELCHLGAVSAALGSPFECPTLWVKNHFPVSNPNLLWHSFLWLKRKLLKFISQVIENASSQAHQWSMKYLAPQCGFFSSSLGFYLSNPGLILNIENIACVNCDECCSVSVQNWSNKSFMFLFLLNLRVSDFGKKKN